MKNKVLYRVWRPPGEDEENPVAYDVLYDREKYIAGFPDLLPKAVEKPPPPKAKPTEPYNMGFEPIFCAHCGAMAFIETKKCRSCRKPFKIEELEPPPITEKAETQAKTRPKKKLTAEEFEESKARLNKLKKKWMLAIYAENFRKPYPQHVLKLEKKIKALEDLIAVNVDIVFTFNLGNGYPCSPP